MSSSKSRCSVDDDDESEETIEVVVCVDAVRRLPPLFARSGDSRMTSASQENARLRVRADLDPALCDGRISSLLGNAATAEGIRRRSGDDKTTVRCTAPSSVRTSRNDGEVHWTTSTSRDADEATGGGIMAWNVSAREVKALQRYRPSIKLVVLATTAVAAASNVRWRSGDRSTTIGGGDDGSNAEEGTSSVLETERLVEELGWVNLDLRDVEVQACGDRQRRCKSRWFKVNGSAAGHKCEMKVAFWASSQRQGRTMTEQEPRGEGDTIATESTPSLDAVVSGSATNGNVSADPLMAILESSRPFTPVHIDEDALQIGQGNDLFHLTICLHTVRNLHRLHESGMRNDRETDDSSPRTAWLSYGCLGLVVQTDQFLLQGEANFPSTADSFRIRSSVRELASFFTDRSVSVLQIHVCSQGAMLGSANVGMQGLLSDAGDNFEERTIRGDFIVEAIHDLAANPTGSSSLRPYVAVTVSLERNCSPNDYIFALRPREKVIKAPSASGVDDLRQHATSFSTTSSQTSPSRITLPGRGDCVESVEDEARKENIYASRAFRDFDEREKKLTAREEKIALAEKTVTQLENAVEKRKLEWEEWRHREERTWHDKLREREAAAMRALEEQVYTREKERASSVEASRLEYGRLEARLRKALVEVEARERQVKNTEATRDAEYKKKVAEVQLQERVLREEVKHAIELERTKMSAVMEQVAIAEKAAVAADRRARQAEQDWEQYKIKQRQSPEATLMQEVANLKGKLAESESRILKERTEKNQALLEKEQFRAAIHKLARALRRERGKTAKSRQREMEQLHLSYAEGGRKVVLDGDRDELRRIQSELSTLHCANAFAPSQSPTQSNSFVKSANSHQTVLKLNSATFRQQPTSTQRTQTPPAPMTPPRYPSTYGAKGGDLNNTNSKCPRAKHIVQNENSGPSPIKAYSVPSTPIDDQMLQSLPKHASESKVIRLKKEREDLLASGNFGSDHPIVVQLDKMLRMAEEKEQTP